MNYQDLKTRTVKVDHLKIHYLTAGSGPVILLIHGWPTSSYLWRKIIPGLAVDYRVIAIDLPGFGQSDKRLEDSFSFNYYSRIISLFLQNLKIEEVSLGVHDLGGPLGLYWAIQNLEKVKRLILLNTLVYPELSWAVRLFGIATILPVLSRWMSGPGGIRRAMLFGVYQKKKLTEEAISNYQEPFKDPLARKVLLKSVQRLSPKGFKSISQNLKKFKGPVQIIYGEKDRILPRVSDTMRRVKLDLPQAQLESLPDCGHFLQEEAPERITEILLKFMNTTG